MRYGFASLLLFHVLQLPALSQDAAPARPTPPTVSQLPRIPAEIHEALQSRDHATAVARIDARLAQAGTPAVDYLMYLKGRAQMDADLLDDAAATFAALEQQHPDSEWRSRARFGRAEILVRARNYLAAGQIYKAEAERLLSRGRKDELARVYLEYADRYFDGVPASDPVGARQPDYAQALAFYQEVPKLGVSPALQRQVEFRMALCQRRLQAHGEAIAAFQALLAVHQRPGAPPEEQLTPAMLAETRYELGGAQLESGQPADARRTWQDLLAADADNADIRSFRVLAASRIPATHGFPQPGNISQLELGLAAVDRFLKEFPAEALAPRIELEAVTALMHHGRFPQAVTRLESLLANPAYAAAKELPAASRMLGQALLAQLLFDDAIAAWKQFLDRYPTDSSWSEVQQAIVDAEFAKADSFREDGDAAQARTLWETFLNKYPLDPRAPRILLQFGVMNNQQGIELQDAERKADPQAGLSEAARALFEAAIADWRRLVQKYPASAEASQAQLLIAVTLEERLIRLPEALEAYRTVTGDYQSMAAQRIANLTEAQLELRTDRKFHTDEQPRVHVSLRNVEKVTLKAYQVDLADYFRKMHLATGLESLDVALIDPDKTLEHPVASYEPYRRIEQDIELPVAGPGVWAVTVASDKLEATTMVIVSDLDMIVKASRNELFVFVENTRLSKPWQGASLLVSDGANVFAEETTAADGVLQKSYGELKSIGDLRVFAVQDGHVASTVTGLNGLDFAVGLTPKGYLFTDRPAYRAGQLVNLKGIVRWVNADRFTFNPGESFRLDVHDSRGRLLHSEAVALSEFGTVASNLQLPESAPQGDYRVHLHQPHLRDGQSYESRFQVVEYRIEPVRLTVDLAERVIYRGEPIRGTIRLVYDYGSPAAGKSLRYRVGDDGAWVDAVTNAAGEVAFEHSTQSYAESQTATVFVEFAERGLSAAQTAYVSARGFEIAVSALRDVFVNGETFDVTGVVTDAAGQPVGAALTLEVLTRATGDDRPRRRGGRGESVVSTSEIQTDPATGAARQTLRLDQPGAYALRLTGTDRFGNRISGQKDILISGDEDAVRLRILADRQHYLVGETATIKLHWRDQPALALVTYDGAYVLGHQLVELQQGVNELAIPMNGHLAPNFTLCVSLMQGHQFHSASSPLKVSQKLQIRMQPSQPVSRPGDIATIDVEVLDANGKPVRTELSVALVQANLLARFQPVQSPLSDVFSAGERTISIRQSTSCTFRYAPSTGGISRFLLADAEQRQVLAREAEALPNLMKQMLTANEPFGGRAGAAGFGQAEFSDSREGLWTRGGANLGDEAEAAKLFDRASGMMTGRGGRPESDSLGREKLYEKLGASDRWQDEASPSSLIWSFDSDFGVLRDGNGDGLVDPKIAAAYVVLGTQLQLTVNGRTRDGRVLALNNYSEAEVLRMVADDGLRVLPMTGESETGFWDPRVVTDEQGLARIELPLPERSTTWKLQARGVTAEALAGDQDVELTTRKELFGELKLPLALTMGDKARILLEVHNTQAEARQVQATFRATIGNKTVELTETVEVAGTGVSEIALPIDLTGVDASSTHVDLEVVLAAGDLSDRLIRTIPVRPHGLPVFAASSGVASQSTIAFAGFPEGVTARPTAAEIVIGPSVNRALIEAVLGADSSLLARCGLPPSNSLERAISDILGGVAVLDSLGLSREAGAPDAVALAGRITSSITTLVSSQRDDGGWSWTGRVEANADRLLTSRAMWALGVARQAGFAVPYDTFERSVSWLNTATTQISPSDLEGQAALLHGLAAVGRADFAMANRLHRERNALSAAGLLNVGLALVHLDRKEMAADLLPLLADRLPAAAGDAGAAAGPSATRNPVELQALQFLLLAAVRPQDPQLSPLTDAIAAARVGVRWPVERSNGPALRALATWHSRTRPASERYRLTVSVNDRQIETIATTSDSTASTRIAIPADALVEGRQQRVNIDLEGRGTFSYSVVLTGFVPADQAASTTKDWQVRRRYEPALREYEGQPIPRGFSVVNGQYRAFVNPLTQLPFAQRGEVTLFVSWLAATTPSDDRYPYLVITEPVPAGCQVLRDSVQGNFERFDIGAGEITFYFGNRGGGQVRYSLVGDLPGDYRVSPTSVRDFYNPSQVAVAPAVALTVLNRGAATADEYRLTPDELFHFGQRKLAKLDYEGAHAAFLELFNAPHRLRDDIYRETVQSLFRTSVAVGRHGEIVKFFEILREKFSDIEVRFEDILTVANAYRELGEYERSYLVYRATIENGFQREARTSGFLEARGELLRSVQVLQSLLRDYPAEGYIASATHALAQEVYRHAAKASDDARLKAAGLTRVHLISEAIQMLDHFLSTWPADPAADEASFAIANALLDLEQYEVAIRRSEQFAERYPESRLIDSFWYTIGLSRFMLGQPEQALEMCRKVAEAKFPDGAAPRDADNKWEAIYIMGQVFHSLGRAAEAIAEYTLVRDRFADAAEAIQFFTRKRISIPNVTTIRPSEDKQVTLSFRNLAEASIKVYRIDLLKFGLLQRNFDRITAINLAGIRPYHEETAALGDGNDFKDREHVLTLPLREEGAYLVVCRGENLYASGLVLVSPLSLEVQEDNISGRVRVTVRYSDADAYASKVQVKVIGSLNEEFIDGRTDLRGLLIADGIRGTSTVIAMADEGRYAFYQGTQHLGPSPEMAAPQDAPPSEGVNTNGNLPAQQIDMLRGRMLERNYFIQEQNRGGYEQLLNNSVEGVKPEQAF
ncbi:MAG: tetratricopeptide repeat protein [Planctomyces sp.]|nr:tetratricopeptide repeat protein [Planctomyces sp.]